MKAHLERDKKEYMIYALVSVLAMILPLFTALERSISDGTFTWGQTAYELIEMAIFLVIIWIHIIFLLPMLFDKKQTGKYITLACALLVVFFISNYITHHSAMEYKHQMRTRVEMQLQTPSENEHQQMGPTMQFDRPASPPELHGIRRIGPSFIETFMVALLFGCTIAIKLMFKHQENVRKLQELDQIRIQQELEQLRTQLSPHFFMNSLNNIHGMVEIDARKAQEMILELSGLMRYVLYENSSTMVTLWREIDFLRNYISLMRVRYTPDRVTINYSFPAKEEVNKMFIPPLILITLFENAFKHGVNYNKHSFVNIELKVIDGQLVLNCANSLHDNLQSDKSGGIGLNNLRKRLDILYDKQYRLDISENDEQYSVTLSIPITNEN